MATTVWPRRRSWVSPRCGWNTSTLRPLRQPALRERWPTSPRAVALPLMPPSFSVITAVVLKLTTCSPSVFRWSQAWPPRAWRWANCRTTSSKTRSTVASARARPWRWGAAAWTTPECSRHTRHCSAGICLTLPSMKCCSRPDRHPRCRAIRSTCSAIPRCWTWWFRRVSWPLGSAGIWWPTRTWWSGRQLMPTVCRKLATTSTRPLLARWLMTPQHCWLSLMRPSTPRAQLASCWMKALSRSPMARRSNLSLIASVVSWSKQLRAPLLRWKSPPVNLRDWKGWPLSSWKPRKPSCKRCCWVTRPRPIVRPRSRSTTSYWINLRTSSSTLRSIPRALSRCCRARLILSDPVSSLIKTPMPVLHSNGSKRTDLDWLVVRRSRRSPRLQPRRVKPGHRLHRWSTVLIQGGLMSTTTVLMSACWRCSITRPDSLRNTPQSTTHWPATSSKPSVPRLATTKWPSRRRRPTVCSMVWMHRSHQSGRSSSCHQRWQNPSHDLAWPSCSSSQISILRLTWSGTRPRNPGVRTL